MKKINFVIIVDNGTKNWHGYQSDTPGLAVCKNLHYDKVKFPYQAWRVIHLDSGKVVPYCNSIRLRKEALKIAADLAQFGDWTQGEHEIVNWDMRSQQVWDIAHQFDK